MRRVVIAAPRKIPSIVASRIAHTMALVRKSYAVHVKVENYRTYARVQHKHTTTRAEGAEKQTERQRKRGAERETQRPREKGRTRRW